MTDVLELVIPYRLKSANVHARRHWTYWHKETHTWQAWINIAICRAGAARDVWNLIEAVEMVRDRRGHLQPREVRRREIRRVTVTRIVTTARHLITDDDNLKFALKPLLDALKRSGLLYDDSREWLEQPSLPEQRVDKTIEPTTIVRLERGLVDGGPRPC